MLDRSSPIPLYVQLAEHLAERKERGEFGPSSQLPGENKLATEYDVSRITVRQAIAGLVDSNTVVRRQGKGTYFTTPKIEQSLERLHTLAEVLSSTGVRSTIRLLEYQRNSAATEGVLHKLGRQEGESVVRMKRVHLVDNQPVVHACIYLSPEYGQYIEGEALEEHSVYDLLENNGHVVIALARQEISATLATAELSDILSVRRGAPLLMMESVSYTDTGSPIDNTFFYCRPDKYAFVATVRRAKTQLALASVLDVNAHRT